MKNIFLDAEFKKVVLSNNELVIKINQVSFLGNIGDFATSPLTIMAIFGSLLVVLWSGDLLYIDEH